MKKILAVAAIAAVATLSGCAKRGTGMTTNILGLFSTTTTAVCGE